MREMGRERPRLRRANVARRPTSRVARAPLSGPTLSGNASSDPIPDRRPISVTVCRTLWAWIRLWI